MCNSKKWLSGLLGVVMCLTLTAAVKQDVKAEGENQSSNYVFCTEDTKLYVEPNSTGEIAASLPQYCAMTFIGVEGPYTKVKFGEMVGYVDSQVVSRSKDIVAVTQPASAAPAVPSVPVVDNEDIRMMAAMIQCEAGNEPMEGQIAVGAVIMNRVKSASYPNTVSEVIYQPYQFGPSDSQMFAGLLANNTIKESCMEAARQAYAGTDNVGGAVHFRRAGSVEGLVIGNHVFY